MYLCETEDESKAACHPDCVGHCIFPLGVTWRTPLALRENGAVGEGEECDCATGDVGMIVIVITAMLVCVCEKGDEWGG